MLRRLAAALRNVFRRDKSLGHNPERPENGNGRAPGADDVASAIQDVRREIERQGIAANQRRRHENQKLVLAWIALGVNAITMAAVIYYACVAKHQLEQSRLAERPWIQVPGIEVRRDITAGQPRKAGNTYILDFDIIMKNVGRSPAFILTVYAEQILEREFDAVAKKRVCAQARERARRVQEVDRWTVSPNGDFAFSSDARLGEEATNGIARTNRGEYRPSLLGCAVYQSLTVRGGQHSSTPFVGNVTAGKCDGRLWRRDLVPVKLDGSDPDLCVVNVASSGVAD